MDTNSLPAALASKTVQSRLYRSNRDRNLDTEQGISLLCEAKLPAMEGPNDDRLGRFAPRHLELMGRESMRPYDLPIDRTLPLMDLKEEGVSNSLPCEELSRYFKLLAKAFVS